MIAQNGVRDSMNDWPVHSLGVVGSAEPPNVMIQLRPAMQASYRIPPHPERAYRGSGSVSGGLPQMLLAIVRWETVDPKAERPSIRCSPGPSLSQCQVRYVRTRSVCRQNLIYVNQDCVFVGRGLPAFGERIADRSPVTYIETLKACVVRCIFQRSWASQTGKHGCGRGDGSGVVD
jgi:hypothetical protein